MAAKAHALRIRGARWENIQKKAWQLSKSSNRVITPADIADALLCKGVDSLTGEDVQMAIKARK